MNIKKVILAVALFALIPSVMWFTRPVKQEVTESATVQLGASVLKPNQGGTGTSTNPSLNSILVGNSSGVYDVKTFTAGTNVTIDNSGSTLTISSTGGGGGSGGGTWSTTTSQVSGRLVNYSANTSDIVAIGSNSTTTAEFWFDPDTLSSYLSGKIGIGTTSPVYGDAGDMVFGLNNDIVLSTNRTTNNFVGGIQFKNEQASTTKSGIDWTGFGTTTSAAWLVYHQSLAGELDGSHGAPHLEVETADLNGLKQGRQTWETNCGSDCDITFNQSNVTITRNAGETNGNLIFGGGGGIMQHVGQFSLYPNYASNATHFLQVGTSTAGNIKLAAGGSTQLDIPDDNLNVTLSAYVGSSLGIGTTSPSDDLTIEKTGSAGTTAGPGLQFRQNQISINSTSNSNLGEITFAGNDIASGEDGIGAKIRAQASDFWNGTTNDYPSDLLFFTNPNGSGALAENMRITSAGNVGIGTTSPYARLSVVGQTVSEYFTSTSSTATSTFPLLSATALSIAGEYISNFTAYVRGLFTGGTGIAITNGDVTFDCSEVEGTGINCSGENVTLDATGDWTGTLDGADGSAYGLVAGDTYSGTHDFGSATVKQHNYPAFTWPGTATTTTATTTVPIGQAMNAQLWNNSTCRVTASTGGYQLSDGTNAMNYFAASTTASRFTLSTNNTFVTDENRVINVGPLTNAQLTCGFDITVNN